MNHAFSIDRVRNSQGITTAFAFGYGCAKYLFSSDTPPRSIHVEGARGNGKSALAHGLATALSGVREPQEGDPLMRNFNWHALSGDYDVTVLDASKLKNPFNGDVFQHVDTLVRSDRQSFIIEHADLMGDDLFDDNSPVRDRLQSPDIRIKIGDPDEQQRQTISIEVLNPDCVKANGIERFTQEGPGRTSWCRVAGAAEFASTQPSSLSI